MKLIAAVALIIGLVFTEIAVAQASTLGPHRFQQYEDSFRNRMPVPSYTYRIHPQQLCPDSDQENPALNSACIYTKGRTADVYVWTSYPSRRIERELYAHEIGHSVDQAWLTSDERRWFKRHILHTRYPWWGNNGAQEAFADAYRMCALHYGKSLHQRRLVEFSTTYFSPTHPRFKRACRWITQRAARPVNITPVDRTEII